VGDVIPLTLSGSFNDGTPFAGDDFVTVVGNNPVGPGVEPVTDEAVLGLASPNPFNPVTRISYELPGEDFVKLTVFDVGGRVVEHLVSSRQSPGEHVVEWDATGRPSGIYFYRLVAGDYAQTRKMIFLK
jgi:hypothetical protein